MCRHSSVEKKCRYSREDKKTTTGYTRSGQQVKIVLAGPFSNKPRVLNDAQ